MKGKETARWGGVKGLGNMVAVASDCARRIAGRTWSEAAISPMSIPVLSAT